MFKSSCVVLLAAYVIHMYKQPGAQTLSLIKGWSQKGKKGSGKSLSLTRIAGVACKFEVTCNREKA